MSMLATRKTKMVMAGIAALALDISAMNAPAAARQKVSDHRASYSLSFVHPAVPTAEASEYRALSAVVGVGY